MNHNDIRHKLSEYIDDTVTPQERAAIDEHLKTCAECSTALAELRKTIDAVKQIEEVKAPAWMTQKIMANVREEQKKSAGFLARFLHTLAFGGAIRVAAVLFLTVTAYYIYLNMNPAEKYGEAPVGRIAKQEAPSPEKDTVQRKMPASSAKTEKQVGPEPGYKSLDMKYSYEKPETPVPAPPGKGVMAPPVEQPATSGAAVHPAAPATSAPAPAKREASTSLKKEAAPMMARDEAMPEAKKAARSAAPSAMAEQAAPAAGKANVPESFDRDREARLAVAEQFAQKDLPESMKTKGLRYDIRRFQADLPDLQWMLGSTAYRSRPCEDKYVVDVDHSGRQLKYLYCHDKTGVRLLGAFELKNDTWTEIK